MWSKLKTAFKTNILNTPSVIVDPSRSEKIINGSFNGATGWTLESPLLASTGFLIAGSGSSNTVNKKAYQTIILVKGARYKFQFQVGIGGGNLQVTPYCGSWSGTMKNSTGVYTEYFIASGTSLDCGVILSSTVQFYDGVTGISITSAP